MLNKIEFKSLFDTYFDTIRSFIFFRCGDEDTASDIAQDVFMRVWEKRNQLNKDNLRALLYKIANEMTISNHRKATHRNDFEQSLSLHDESDLSVEDELLYREFRALYAKALKQMPETQRVVFMMSRNEELRYHEIAERLNISVKAVEKRMSVALQFLKKKLY